MSTKNSKQVDWSLAELWNGVAYKEDKPLKKRDYIYASEIGMPFYDRWNKMKAVPYTNPPNMRSRRKFLSGNIWEYVVKQILIACGMYHLEEVKLDSHPYNGLLEVHGRCDFISGGFVDGDQARLNVELLKLPDALKEVADKLIQQLEGKSLKRKILEIKSVSTFAMDKVERLGEPVPNHTMQGYHYHRNGDIPAEVAYICKDDCRMAQFAIVPDHSEPLYRADIEQMTEYFKKRKPPPLAPLVSFDFSLGCFTKNLGVEWSPYLSHYGFKTPEEYRERVAYVTNWNRTLNRFVMAETGGTTPTGKPIQITSKNQDTKNEIIKAGHDFNKILECKIKLGLDGEDDE